MLYEKPTLYFEKAGEDNTDACLAAAKRRADELGIRDVVVATTNGGVGLKAAEVFRGYNLVAVTHSAGYREPGKLEVDQKTLDAIRAAGGKVLTTGHAFAGVSRAINRKFSTLGPAELVANTLRVFGQGMKVVVEISFMAADAGLLPMNRDIVCVAGTGRGADTAVVISPKHLNDLFDVWVKEIIAKPANR